MRLSRKAMRDLAKNAHSVVILACVAPIRAVLGVYATNAGVWVRGILPNSDRDMEDELTMLSPLPTITAVGEQLFSLVPLLENSGLIARWLGAALQEVSATIVSQVTQIPALSQLGFAQLLCDLEYANNVLSALGGGGGGGGNGGGGASVGGGGNEGSGEGIIPREGDEGAGGDRWSSEDYVVRGSECVCVLCYHIPHHPDVYKIRETSFGVMIILILSLTAVRSHPNYTTCPTRNTNDLILSQGCLRIGLMHRTPDSAYAVDITSLFLPGRTNHIF